MRDYLKEFSGDVIGDFLVENDIKDILKEAGSPTTNAPLLSFVVCGNTSSLVKSSARL